ncbi:hypothetical protein [Yinghuangia seranimata]|uniref:hypothetical protein n=1 Tax=Yinghuangia seranimata TaxID=408067 RepID=UPI00248AD0D6|nr:hypothetical protein [Yinghuangia seranimata]MDI2127731.1 hypothetical protein [Yinghuangia seranimata]
MWAPGTVFGGRYTLVELIATGGVSAVWWADDAVSGRRVVLKVVHPVLGGKAVAAAQFHGEARLLGSLEHPEGAYVGGAGRAGGSPRTPYVVAQFVDGRTPAAQATASGPLPYERIPEVVAHSLEALHMVHRPAVADRRAVAHRGVEPLAPAPLPLHGAARRSPRRRRRAVAALPAAAAIAATTLFAVHSCTVDGSRAPRADQPIAQQPVVPGPAVPRTTPPADAATPTGPGSSPSTASGSPGPAGPPAPVSGGQPPTGPATHTAPTSGATPARGTPGGGSGAGSVRPSAPPPAGPAAAQPRPTTAAPAPAAAATPSDALTTHLGQCLDGMGSSLQETLAYCIATPPAQPWSIP